MKFDLEYLQSLTYEVERAMAAAYRNPVGMISFVILIKRPTPSRRIE